MGLPFAAALCRVRAAFSRRGGAWRRKAFVLSALALACAPRAPAQEPAAQPAADPAAVLRRALQAAREQRTDEAVGALAALATSEPLIADHADLLRARTLQDAGRPADALAAAAEGEARSPESPLRTDLEALRGDAERALGHEAEARTAWSGAAALTDDPARLARLAAARAASFERSGDPPGSAEAWRELWVRFPTEPDARDAGARLDTLEASLGHPVRSADDYRARGDALFAAGWSQDALAAYDGAIAHGLSDADALRAVRLRRAHCLFRLRRYAEAKLAFEAAGPSPEAALYRVRAIARGGDVPAAIEEFEKLAARTRGSAREQALLFAAILLDDQKEPEKANALYARVAREGKDGALVSQATWRLGWAAYRAGDYTEARRQLEHMAKAESDPVSRLQPLYWSARAGEHAGVDGATQELARLGQEWPLAYYGWRAASRSAEEGHPVPDPVPPAVDPGPASLAPADLARPRILLEGGLEQEAQEELARASARAGGLGDRLAVAQLLEQAGAYDRAQSLVAAGNGETLARAPAPALIELWRTAWPDAYADLVRQAMPPEAKVEPALVWAIMREESGYRPRVMSSAGARGLLQLMPDTASRLAGDAGLTAFQPEDLFEPEVNVRLGALYLDQLLRRFDGRLSAAIGSYNAGPEAVARWLAERGSLDDDEWVESIPYDQTRGYVRRVLRSFHAYRVLY